MAIRISAVKGSRLSDDKKEVIVASTGKYTGELELRFACECVDDLIRALVEARGDLQPTNASTPMPVALPSAPPKTNGPDISKNPDEVRFEIPRNFTITADSSGRRLVLFIVNHKLDRQAGYALSPDAAKQLAGGLVKSAEALLVAAGCDEQELEFSRQGRWCPSGFLRWQTTRSR
jgi:hypothetical protein